MTGYAPAAAGWRTGRDFTEPAEPHRPRPRLPVRLPEPSAYPNAMRRPLPDVLVLGLAVALSACGGVAGALDTAAELIAEGGQRQLRTPMRAAAPGPRVLVLALDGVGEETLRRALAGGRMPRLGAFLGPGSTEGALQSDVWQHAAVASRAVSVFPAETAPGWAALYTGEPPARNGVTGNEWFDRDSLAVFAPVPLSVGTIEQTLEIWADSLVGEVIQTPTLFERADVRSHVASAFVYRGADLLTLPDLNDFGDLVEAAGAYLFGNPQAVYEEIDDDTWEGVQAGVAQFGVPRLQVAYFPGVDLLAHAEGSSAQIDYLEAEIDPHLGKILDLWGEAGALGETYVLVVSDHGHTATLADGLHSLGGGSERADRPAVLVDSLGYRLRDFSVDADTSDADLVMIYDEAVAMLYAADRSTCPADGDVCDWRAAPRLRHDVLPLARGFAEAGSRGRYVPELRGTLDLVFARASDPSGRTSPPFRLFVPDSSHADGGRLEAVGAYLARTGRTDLVDLERRLGWLTDGPLGHRAGDVLLLANAGDGRPLDERFYFGSPRSSGHGSASASDGYISFVLAHAGQTGAELQARLRAAVGDRPTQLDVTPLILHLLDAPR